LPAQEKALYHPVSKDEAAKLMGRINQWFTAMPSYSFAVTYATYAGAAEKLPHEESHGYFKKFNGGLKSCLMNVYTIQNKNFLISVDSSKKMIVVCDPPQGQDANHFSFDEYVKVAGQSTSVKLADNGKTKTLRMEFKSTSVSAYEFCIAQDNKLLSVDIFYNKEVKSLDGKMVKPRLSMVFQNYSTGISPAKDEISESRYFTINHNQLILKEAYKNYRLLDQRIKNDY
jgi:hypothetical protein